VLAVFLVAAMAGVHARSEPPQPAMLKGAVKEPLVLDDALLKSLPASPSM